MQKKMAIVIFADTDTPEAMGRITNGLGMAKDFKSHGYELTIIFDGAGTRWIGKLIQPDHKFHKHYKAVEENVKGACSFCSNAFGVKHQVEQAGVTLLDEFEGHPSIRKLTDEGFEVITV